MAGQYRVRLSRRAKRDMDGILHYLLTNYSRQAGEIDLLVYRLYGLTWAEVKVVDAGFGLSEEEYNTITHE